MEKWVRVKSAFTSFASPLFPASFTWTCRACVGLLGVLGSEQHLEQQRLTSDVHDY